MNKIQVVILCAGKGTRLLPLTQTTPKVLVDINGKSTLERNLDTLSGIASEIILVVGYLADKIKEKIGEKYNGIPIKYIIQSEALGTGDAILSAKELLEERFMVMGGDDLHSRRCIEKLCEFDLAIAGGIELENPQNFGVLEVDLGFLCGLEEKPEKPKSNIVNIGVYILNKSIFDHKLEKSQRGEYEIVDYLKYLLEKGEKIKVVETDFWMPVGNHKELEIAREIFKD